MTDKELHETKGGAISFTSASWLSALSKGINTLYNLGRSIGTSFRMIISGKKC